MGDDAVSRADGLRLALGLGPLAALVEVAASWGDLPLGPIDVAALLAASALVSTAVAGLAALVVNPIHGWMRASPPHHAVAAQLGLAAGALGLAHAGPAALARADRGEAGAAAMLLGMVALAGLVVLFNARFLLLRVVRGQAPPIGWLPAALGASALGGAALAVAAGGARGGGGVDVLLLTIDGLRADALRQGDTPALDALAARGAWFSQVVAPTSSTLANHATMLTGIHPLAHGAVDDLHPVAPVELVVGEGAGAFVSTVAVGAHAGLADGFVVYDDAVGGLRGLDRLGLTRRALGRWLGGGSRRADAETIAAWRAWRAAVGPGMAWVELGGLLPGGPVPARGGDWAAERAAYRERLRAVDAAVGEAVAAASGDALVVVASAGGLSLGDHGLAPYDASAWDEAVRAPVIVTGPGVPAGEVPQAARLVDVGATILTARGGSARAEGVDLLGQARSPRELSLVCVLLAANLDGGPVLGLRNGGVKYLLDVDNDVEWLIDLAADPAELHDLSSEQPDAARQARAALGPELGQLPRLAVLPRVDAGVAARVGELLGRP